MKSSFVEEKAIIIMRFSSFLLARFFLLCNWDKKKRSARGEWRKFQYCWGMCVYDVTSERTSQYGRNKSQFKNNKLETFQKKRFDELTFHTSHISMGTQRNVNEHNNNLSDSSMALDRQNKKRKINEKPRSQQLWCAGISKNSNRVSLVFASSPVRRWIGENIATFHWEMQKTFLLLLFSLQDLASPLCRFGDKFCSEFTLRPLKKLSSRWKCWRQRNAPLFVFRMI